MESCLNTKWLRAKFEKFFLPSFPLLIFAFPLEISLPLDGVGSSHDNDDDELNLKASEQFLWRCNAYESFAAAKVRREINVRSTKSEKESLPEETNFWLCEIVFQPAAAGNQSSSFPVFLLTSRRNCLSLSYQKNTEIDYRRNLVSSRWSAAVRRKNAK